MPIYEYRCKDCQQVFEEWCKHIEDDKVHHICPICKGEAQRLISHTSFALKGGGWYVTEYGSHKGREEKPVSCTHRESKGDASPPSPPAPSTPAASS